MKMMPENLKKSKENNKMIGYGRFRVDSISKSVFDFTNINDLLKYMLMETDSTEITQDILGREQETSKVRFKIKGKNGINIKGVIRSRAERLHRTFPCIGEEILTNIKD